MERPQSSGWRPWGDFPLVVIITMIGTCITILVFITGVPTLQQLWHGSSEWKVIDWWPKITDETKLVDQLNSSFRVLREMYSGVERDEKGVPRANLYFGISRTTPADQGNVELRIEPKAKGAMTPKLIAFVVRDREGYYKLVDINPETGMPKDTKATDQAKVWDIPNYKAGERLKVVLFVIPPPQQNVAELKEVKVEDIISATLNKKP